MKFDDETTREVQAVILVLVLSTVAVTAWFIDPMTGQRVFSMMMAVELVAFAMFTYLVYKPNLAEVSRTWFLIGSASIALFLFIALALAGQ